ncbi:SoxR reducing system RseC family protein [Candidatus Moduliflexota bacterium]
MNVEEKGVVVEAGGEGAKVRAEGGAQCAGCGAAKHCQGGAGEKVVEAANPLGAKKGDRVVIAVPAGELLKASFQVYIVPVIGILTGAGAAQLAVQVLWGPETAGAAAGIGGLAGAAISILFMRSLRSRRTEGGGLRPTIVRIVDAA